MDEAESRDDLAPPPSPQDALTEQYSPDLQIWRFDDESPDGLREPDGPDPQDVLPIPFTPENLVCLRQPPPASGSLSPGSPHDPNFGWPQCRHLGRQLMPFGNPQHEQKGARLMIRFCMHPAKRGLNGASMIFTESDGMYACSLRDPQHEPSLAKIEAFEREQEERRNDKRMFRMFRTPEEAAAGISILSEDDGEVVK